MSRTCCCCGTGATTGIRIASGWARTWCWRSWALIVRNDLVEKRGDYAEAGVPEYWIVDPRTSTVTVLALEAGSYIEHGVFSRSEVATSATIPDFQADVAEVFDASEPGRA